MHFDDGGFARLGLRGPVDCLAREPGFGLKDGEENDAVAGVDVADVSVAAADAVGWGCDDLGEEEDIQK